MCVPVNSLLLFTLTTSIFCGTMMATEGLPLGRQERGVDRGVLAGDDFLSVFMRSSRTYKTYRTTTTTTEIPLTTTEELSTPTEDVITSTDITTVLDNSQDVSTTTSAPSSSDSRTDLKNNSVVVAVRVSSTVDRTISNNNKLNTRKVESTTLKQNKAPIPDDQTLVASEDHPSIIAQARKSEFSVEESEPITTNMDLTSSGRDYEREYPASVQPLPRNNQSPYNPGYLGQNDKEKVQPIQHTVIFHNGPRDSGRARSVSYSTVIQAVPHPTADKTWGDDKPVEHERRERHYEGVQPAFSNTFQEILEKSKNSSLISPKIDKNWDSGRSPLTTERNWEVREKLYPSSRRLPTVYGVPEQNYEVDESASVMTNGRLHGVQATPTAQPPKQEIKIGESKKTDDNQKVGYVVEGRNYRKYRVEERTSDGFIVGEYGVVSHDDGSLRGVRYTADGTINPRLIYDALMKFLAL